MDDTVTRATDTSATTDVMRLAVLDDGEPVVRVLGAIADLARGDAGLDVTTVLVHPGTATPWFAREADETLPLPGATGPQDIDARRLVAALVAADIDAVWLGRLVAHRPEDLIAVVAACEDAGIHVAGPSASALRVLTDPTAAAEAAGLPCAGDEPAHRGARVVEIDVLADGDRVLTLPPRDIAATEDGRLVFAEFPAAGLPDAVVVAAESAARRLADHVGYRGAASLRLRVDDTGVCLVAVDPLARPEQALHDETLTSLLVRLRVGLVAGRSLPGSLPDVDGHAVAVALLAYDPDRGVPSTQEHVVRLVDLPTGVGVRADVSLRPGDAVGDVVAGIGAWGRDRDQALARLRRALERTTVVLDDAVTTRSALLLLLGHPDVLAGPIDQGRYTAALESGDLEAPADPVALVAAAVEAYEADLASVRAEFLASAARGRPQRPEEVGARLTLDYRGSDVEVTVERRSHRRYHVVLTRPGADPVAVDAEVDVLGDYERRLSVGGRKHRVVASEQGAAIRLEIDGLAHTVVREDGMAVRTERPALVAELAVAPGDEVRAGQVVATLESMKMLSSVTSPYDGVVTSLAVLPNTQVERGATLLRVRADVTGASGGQDSALDLAALAAAAPTRRASTRRPGTSAAADATAVYRRLRDYLLGYDLAPSALRALLAEQKAVTEQAAVDDPELVAAEDDLLDLFADLASLYRPRTEGEVSGASVGSDPRDGTDVEAGLDSGSEGALESVDTQEYVLAFLQWMDADRAGLPRRYRDRLTRALSRYGVERLTPGPELDAATVWLFRSFSRVPALAGAVSVILDRRLGDAEALRPALGTGARARLDRLAASAEGRAPAVANLARDLAFTLFEEPALEAVVASSRGPVLDLLADLRRDGVPDAAARDAAVDTLLAYPHPLRAHLLQAWIDSDEGDDALREVLLAASLRRYYRQHELTNVSTGVYAGVQLASADYVAESGQRVHLIWLYSALLDTYALGETIRAHLEEADLLTGSDAEATDVVIGVLSWRRSPIPRLDELSEATRLGLEAAQPGRRIERFDLTVTSRSGLGKEHTRTQHVSFTQDEAGQWSELQLYRNLHPSMAERLGIWRFSNFRLSRLASPEDVYLFLGIANDNPADRRLFALVEARDLTRVEDEGHASYPHLERLGLEALAAMRSVLSTFPPRQRPAANRLIIVVRPEWDVPAAEWPAIARRYETLARGVGLEKLVVHVRMPEGGDLVEKVIFVEGLGGRGLAARLGDPGPNPIRPLTPYAQKVLTAERFGAPYPYEIIRMLTPAKDAASSFPHGRFTELELDEGDDVLVPIERDAAQNFAHLVVGEITTYTDVVPEGMRRVAILSDPTQGLGNLSEPECRRINAALAYAEEHRLPVEWYAVSSGALIALDSGTENMDWISLTLRRIIEFTQRGGEINIIVTGINVGGQPYWNAEATMLMHTKGILVMTPASQMVLTGKQALDFSGAVSAEDNYGIGGYDRIMGPNGQAHYWAPSFEEACRLLLRHYDYTYVVPGERFPRRRPTSDDAARDVRTSPHAELAASPFTTVGQVFEENPERKLPFDMRSVMRAVADTDDDPLERWRLWRDSDTSIVWDATIGGIPVCLLGLESHAVPRTGFVPSDGPPAWTSGTLFPQASRKTARAINAASGNRPLVVLANLSGFDGSPESMRNWQLEYGAEIGRAVTNFDGPIVFVVVSRYHGGAFVVFSKQLNDHMEIAAVEGSYASVIGGAPAAATVFAREVKKRTGADPRVVEAASAVDAATGRAPGEVAALRATLADVTARVRSEKLGEMADEFDGIHSVQRAQRVGSVDHIIAPADLRPWIIDALDRGMARFV